MDEAPLRHAMFDYSCRILNLSLGISIFTAALVYLSLHLLMVRPIRRITESMAAFRANPDFAAGTLPDSERSDEIGIAPCDLATTQQVPRAALLKKTRLPALRPAPTKANNATPNTPQ